MNPLDLPLSSEGQVVSATLHLLNWKHLRETELIGDPRAVEEFEVRRIQELESKRDLRKSGPPSTSNFECQISHRMCRSRIGLLAHNKSHL